MIEEIISHQLILKACESKRNQVHVVKGMDESLYVLKRMQDENSRKQEIKFLQLLRDNGVAVPCIIETCGEYILLEYLEGETYLEKYEELEADIASEKEIAGLIHMLLDWIEQFYQVTKKYYNKQIIIQDINFRNFIVDQDRIYGVDFELCKEGDIVGELGKIVAFAFLYEPIGTLWKQRFVDCFIQIASQKFCINREELEHVYYNQLEKITNRRKRNTPFD